MLRGTLFISFAGLVACGGKAIIDPPSEEPSTSATSGAGGSKGPTGTVTVTIGGGGAPPTPCEASDDCPDGQICLFQEGVCVDACDVFEDPCGPGEICDDCATGSCPNCLDCVAACVPAEPGQCDEHDDCADDELCVFGTQRCAPVCESAQCADPNLACDPCGTSSCPGCKDCAPVCLPL